jgi:hypothetical protein
VRVTDVPLRVFGATAWCAARSCVSAVAFGHARAVSYVIGEADSSTFRANLSAPHILMEGL